MGSASKHYDSTFICLEMRNCPRGWYGICFEAVSFCSLLYGNELLSKLLIQDHCWSSLQLRNKNLATILNWDPLWSPVFHWDFEGCSRCWFGSGHGCDWIKMSTFFNHTSLIWHVGLWLTWENVNGMQTWAHCCDLVCHNLEIHQPCWVTKPVWARASFWIYTETSPYTS